MNLDFGHNDPQWIMPLGVRAEIDFENRSIALIEPAVA
jgi:muramoyltetrapeptide carboxypeptidase LdcA involved in peptidoglycan recycling